MASWSSDANFASAASSPVTSAPENPEGTWPGVILAASAKLKFLSTEERGGKSANAKRNFTIPSWPGSKLRKASLEAAFHKMLREEALKVPSSTRIRSEEHTSELQSQSNL